MENDDYKWMEGKTFKTPYEPSGLVKVLLVEEGFHPVVPKITVIVEYLDNIPGYEVGSTGRYFADDLKPYICSHPCDWYLCWGYCKCTGLQIAEDSGD